MRRASIVVALSVGWSAAAACGGTTAGAGTDTSTNWLKSCESTEECSLGSTCSCGRCTLECSVDADCGVFSAGAACVAIADRCAEQRLCMPGPPEVEFDSLIEETSSCTHAASDYMLDSPALCFGRELPECPPGSESFIDPCGCGCSAAADNPRQCRDQCELAGSCEEQRFEEFDDYATTRESWRDIEGAVAGECSNARRFVYFTNGTIAQGRIFTPGGLFLGLGTATDVVSAPCWGEGYWPEPVRCEMPTVTEVLSTGFPGFQTGQVVHLPWSEGDPGRFF